MLKSFKSEKKFEDKIRHIPVQFVNQMIRKLFPDERQQAQAEEQ